jgi:hypothetical protein
MWRLLCHRLETKVYGGSGERHASSCAAVVHARENLGKNRRICPLQPCRRLDRWNDCGHSCWIVQFVSYKLLGMTMDVFALFVMRRTVIVSGKGFSYYLGVFCCHDVAVLSTVQTEVLCVSQCTTLTPAMRDPSI